MPCIAKVKVGTVPREFILSSLINMSRSNERLRTSESAGIPIQSFMGTGDPSPPQSASHPSAGPLPLIPPVALPWHFCPVEVQGLLLQSLPHSPHWSDEDNSPGHSGRNSIWRNWCCHAEEVEMFGETSGLLGGYPNISVCCNQYFPSSPCPLALAAVGNSLCDMLNDFLLLWLWISLKAVKKSFC